MKRILSLALLCAGAFLPAIAIADSQLTAVGSTALLPLVKASAPNTAAVIPT